MNQYDQLVEGVVDAKNVHESLTKLLSNIASQYMGTEAHAQALAGVLQSRGADLVTAVLANTPMVTATFPAPKPASEASAREEEEPDKKAKPHAVHSRER